jgi:hypothetical protein
MREPFQPILFGDLPCARCGTKMGSDNDDDGIRHAVNYGTDGSGVYSLCVNCRAVLTVEQQLPYYQNLWLYWMTSNNGPCVYRTHIFDGSWTFDKVYEIHKERLESYGLIKEALEKEYREKHK